MKHCPSCNRTYSDVSLNYCLEDGTPLVADTAPAFDPQATVRYPSARDTSEPPPTEIYRQPAPLLNQVPELVQHSQQQQPQWTPTPTVQRKKSGAIWWVLGGFLVVGVIGVGLIIMIVAIASMTSTNTNHASDSNSNSPVVNRNSSVETNTNTNSDTRSNVNSANLPASFSDNFSEQKWGTGDSKFGRLWYADDEYHMSSKEKTFIVMYGPTNDYNTENATVRVTARSVDGVSPPSGFGLIIHGEKSKKNDLEDYALLIYTGDQPQYEVVMHKDGAQTPVISWTKSSVIRGGTNPNQLEARVNGTEISFYINGQYVNKITDTQNYRRGVAGLYTSDSSEVAFDDLEITRNN